MVPRRRTDTPVGTGLPEIPYDRFGAVMPGMEVPQPGGTMKKMSFEFTDPEQQAAAAAGQQPQIPQGAGIPPAGMEQGAIPPQGMQGMQDPSQMQGDPSQMQGQMPMLAQGAIPDDGGFSNMLSDQDLSMMADDGTDMQGQQMADASMDPTNPQSQQMQLMLMDAARRRLNF